MNAKAVDNKIIWRFSDGRSGHDTQSKGLVLALSSLIKCETHDVSTPVPISNYACGVFKKFPLTRSLPDPDLLIGAGHSTHVPMLLARHARGGYAVVLMKPSLPTKLFDLCLVPDHDKPKPAENIVSTCGPLNPLQSSSRLSPEQGLILVGGTSKHFQWQNARLLEQLSSILKQGNVNWTITDSPRTPQTTRAILQKMKTDRISYIPYAEKNTAQLPDLLQKAGTVWVTEDSMSMIYEALSTGAQVGLIRVSSRNNGRLASVSQTLADRQMLTLFDDWITAHSLLPRGEPLYESARCAKELIRRCGWAPGPTS